MLKSLPNTAKEITRKMSITQDNMAQLFQNVYISNVCICTEIQNVYPEKD